MKVVFLDNIEGGARTGDIKEVKNGYARNYLLPRGLALPATKQATEKAQAHARAEDRRQTALDDEARKVATRIGGEPLHMHARVGETGRLYGSITAADIATALGQRSGGELDRRTIELGEPIRQVGVHTVHVRLTRNVSTDVQVVVEGADEE